MDQTVESPDIETASVTYAKRFSGDWGKYLLGKQESLVAECLPERGEGLNLLSVGGGHAQLTDLYTRRNFATTVYGSDGAPVELLAPYEVQYQSGNILNLPFEDNSFDVVVAIRLLTHLDNWPRLLEEMCRVSKGQVIVEYPSKRSLNIISPILFKFKKQFEGDTRTFTLFTDTQVKKQLALHDYKKEYRKGQFFFPLVVHRMFKSNGILRAVETLLSKIGLSSVLGSPVVMSAGRQK